jgi:DNA-binding transcriptional LysR family regulator
MNLQQLYYFRTLAEVKNFTKASIQLMVTQPSLSHSINDLEAELGISLFDRSNRQVKLTKYGELFLEYVDKSLNILDEGRTKLNDFISPEHGTVSFYYVSSLDAFIPYLIARFYKEGNGSKCVFQFQQTTNIEIQAALRRGDCDLGIGMLYDDAAGLETYKLGEHELVLLVSSNHPLAQQDSVDLRQIKGERFITYKEDCTIRGLIDTVLSSMQLSPQIVLETVHDTMIYGTVAANFGVALVPAPLNDKGHSVKALRIENQIPAHTVYLKWKDAPYMSPAVAHFRDFIIKHDGIFNEYLESFEKF